MNQELAVLCDQAKSALEGPAWAARKFDRKFDAACVESGRNGTLAILGEIISPIITDDPHIEGFLTMTNQRGSAAGLALIALTAVLVFSLAGCFGHHESVKFDTPYQAVLLANGSVYFGHLNDYGTRHPVLTDVFYIVSQTDPNTKETKNVLVKRGKELHAPDRMYLTPTAIIFVEPVGKDSKVAQLISQAEH